MAAMDEDLEDEEVIFKNSALFEYLKDTGFTDFEFCQRDLNKEKSETTGTTSKTFTKSWFTNKFSNIAASFSLYIKKYFQNPLHYLHYVDLRYLPKYINDVFESNLLEYEDQILLEELNQGKSFVQNPKLPDKSFICSKSLSFLVALSSCFIGRIYLSSISFMKSNIAKTDFLFVLLILLILSSELKKIWSHWHRRKIHKKNFHLLREFIHNNKALTRTLKKAIRLIQETEVINRGFTLVSQMTPVAHLELSSLQRTQRQCPLLRQAVFDIARQNIFLFRKQSLHLNEIIQEGPSYMIAEIKLDDFGPCMILPKDSEQLREATDGYSLTALKGICQVSNLQRSEFLRIFLIGVITALTQGKDKNVDLILEISDSFQTTNNFVKEVSNQLTLCYESHKVFFHSTNDLPSCKPLINEEMGYFHSTYIAVHSLNLHLQAALNRVHSLECEIEAVPSIHSESNDSSLMSDFEQKLQHILLDLESCKDCWEEAMKRLNKSSKELSKDNENGLAVITQPSTIPSKKPVSLLEIGDPIIEDEVFEAYTDPHEKNSESNFYEVSDDDCKKQKEEHEVSLRLLKELKNVLTIKAAEMESREQRALAASQSYPIVEAIDSLEINTLSKSTVVKTGQEKNTLSPCQQYSDVQQPVVSLTLSCFQPGLVSEESSSLNPIALPIIALQLENKSDNNSSIYQNLRDKDSNYVQASYSDGQLDDNCRFILTNHKPPSNNQGRLSQNDEETNAGTDSLVELLDSKEDLFFDRHTKSDKLQRLTQTNLSFAANVASMAVARSNQMKLASESFLLEEQFSDEGETDDE